MSFDTLGLSPKVLAAIEAAGYTQPTPIQEQSIPIVLEKRDVLGIAQTGTGKTASFTLPMLTLLERGRARARMPRTLILEPTRELAAQVHENFEKYGINHKLTVALLIGGVSFDEQDRKLTRGADVLIATPGRLLDHIERGKLLLTGVEVLVIDEADRMLDMGFIPDIERICKMLPPRRQTLFFSATMPPEITRLAKQFLNDPARVEVAPPSTTSETVSQSVVQCRNEAKEKRAALRSAIDSAEGVTNGIIFCNRKRDVGIVHRSLERHGYDAAALHGDMDQHARTETLTRFRAGEVMLLVASDVAARGLDIPAVSHVFNYDVPTHAEDYVHRIGRTGRAGRTGTAIMLVTPADRKYLGAIEKLIKMDITVGGDEPVVQQAATEEQHEAQADAAETPKAENDTSGSGRRRSRRRGGKKNTREDAPAEQTSEAPDDQPAKSAEKSITKPAQDSRKRDGRPNDRRKGGDQVVFGESEFVPAFLLRPVRPAPKVDDAADDEEDGELIEHA